MISYSKFPATANTFLEIVITRPRRYTQQLAQICNRCRQRNLIMFGDFDYGHRLQTRNVITHSMWHYSMKVSRTFEIHDSFKISNRGIVLTGTVLTNENEIEINVGEKISFQYKNEKMVRKITGIEKVFGKPRFGNMYFNSQNIGILIECVDDAEIEKLGVWEPNKVLAELII